MTPSGIESATFRLVAQHINHCATAPPPPINEVGMQINHSTLHKIVAEQTSNYTETLGQSQIFLMETKSPGMFYAVSAVKYLRTFW